MDAADSYSENRAILQEAAMKAEDSYSENRATLQEAAMKAEDSYSEDGATLQEAAMKAEDSYSEDGATLEEDVVKCPLNASGSLAEMSKNNPLEAEIKVVGDQIHPDVKDSTSQNLPGQSLFDFQSDQTGMESTCNDFEPQSAATSGFETNNSLNLNSDHSAAGAGITDEGSGEPLLTSDSDVKDDSIRNLQSMALQQADKISVQHEIPPKSPQTPPCDDIRLDSASDQAATPPTSEDLDAQCVAPPAHECSEEVKSQEFHSIAEDEAVTDNAFSGSTELQQENKTLEQQDDSDVNGSCTIEESVPEMDVIASQSEIFASNTAAGLIKEEYDDENDPDQNKSFTSALPFEGQQKDECLAETKKPEPNLAENVHQPDVTPDGTEFSKEDANKSLDLGVGAELESMKTPRGQAGLSKKSSDNHTVMFDINKLNDVDYSERPLPPYFKAWHRHMNADNYVRLACHTSRWEEIKQRLNELRNPGVNYYHLEEVIIFCGSLDREFNTFDVLKYFFNEDMQPEEADHFFRNLLPVILDLAVKLPELIQAPIPLLKHGRVMKLSLTQLQIASLLANAFFCTFPHQGGPYDRFPSINFHSLYSSGRHPSPCSRRIEKLRCFFHYINRISRNEPSGIVTISRRRLKQSLDWSVRTEPMPELLHVSNTGTIEDTDGGFLEADFANKYIGGGVLGHGFVQEEIRFSICPELIVTRLVVECLDDREALHVKGFERFSNYTGYANSCQWDGDHQDARTVGLDRRRVSHLVGMDALKFSNWREQFHRNNIDRELHKALVAFGDVRDNSSLPQRAAVATGNWGCGAFKGDVRLKFLIQLLACTVSGRSMAYFTFGDQRLQQRLLEMHQFLREKEVCVGGVYQAVISFTEHLGVSNHGGWQYDADSAPDLFSWVREYVLQGASAPPLPEPSVSKKQLRNAKKRERRNKQKQERQQNQFEGLKPGSQEERKPEEATQDKVPNDQSEKLGANLELEQAASNDQSHANSCNQVQETQASERDWKQVGKRSGRKASEKSETGETDKLGSKMSNMSLSEASATKGANRRKRGTQSSSSDTEDGASLAKQATFNALSGQAAATTESRASATPAGCATNQPPVNKKKLKKSMRRKANKSKNKKKQDKNRKKR